MTTQALPTAWPKKQREALEKLFHRIGEVSSLPISATRILNVANDDSAGASDLLAAVEGDPAVAVRILRTVNASFYSVRNRIGDLKQAITLLGFREVRNMALTVYVAEMFHSNGDYRNYSREALWDHMVAVAAMSRMIADVCGTVPPDEAYCAGLLHDVGLILIDQYLRRHFTRVLDSLTATTPTMEIEDRILTFNHSQLGEFVTRQWNFSEPIVAAAGYHHHPQHYNGPQRDMVMIVALANYLCSRQEITSLGEHNVTPPADDAYHQLGIESGQMSSILQRLDQTLSTAALAAAV